IFDVPVDGYDLPAAVMGIPGWRGEVTAENVQPGGADVHQFPRYACGEVGVVASSPSLRQHISKASHNDRTLGPTASPRHRRLPTHRPAHGTGPCRASVALPQALWAWISTVAHPTARAAPRLQGLCPLAGGGP